MSAVDSRRVLVTFDKFKGALGARQACEIVRDVIQRERPGWRVDMAPLTDGGDGFCRILTDVVGGSFQSRWASGPRFEGGTPLSSVEASIGRVELASLPRRARDSLDLPAGARRLAIVELASVNGLALVPRDRADVWQSSTYGTGELLQAAAQLEVDAILLGVGGSATSDLGLGALGALGFEFLDAADRNVGIPVPALWGDVVRITGELARLPPLRIACDVASPVFGAFGAATVFGPQKGLSLADVPRLEAEGERLATLLCEHVGASADYLTRPGAGAAGGIAFGLAVAAGARLVPGSELVSAWLALEQRLRACDCVITGEGRFDESSWAGKGPGAVVVAARAAGRPCVVFAGSVASGITAAPSALEPACELVAISDPAEPLERALLETELNLARSVRAWLSRME